MATKTLPATEKAAFVARFTLWVQDTHEGNQTHAGKAIGISQAHVSALMSGERGPGLTLLLLLRKKTGISLDEWLGLVENRAAVSVPTDDELDARIRRHLEATTRPREVPGAPPPKLPDPQPRRRA